MWQLQQYKRKQKHGAPQYCKKADEEYIGDCLMKDKYDLPTEEDLIAVWEWLNTLPPKEAEKLMEKYYAKAIKERAAKGD